MIWGGKERTNGTYSTHTYGTAHRERDRADTTVRDGENKNGWGMKRQLHANATSSKERASHEGQ